MNPFKILVILTLGFIAFSVETDVYVPSFPDMVTALGIGEGSIQRLLSINFLGICISCLFSGPLSDSYGRKRILSIGTGIFMVASLICCLFNHFETLLIGRFIQGLGAGSILAVAGTCIFDFCDPTESGQLVAILNSAVTVSMALAPITGVWLNTHYGWHSCFLFIFILSFITWVSMTFFLPETLKVEARVPLKPGRIIKDYAALLFRKQFITNTLTWVFMVTATVVYTANASLLFLGHFNLSPRAFGIYQSITMGAFGAASLLCSYLIGKWGGPTVKKAGTLLFFIGTLGLLAINFYNPISPILISLAMATISAGASIACVVYFTDSMIGVSAIGAALSLVQFFRLFFCAEFTDLSRVLFNGNLSSIVIVLCAVAILSLMTLLLSPRQDDVPNNEILKITL